MSLVSLTITLFLIMDSPGCISDVVDLLSRVEKKRRSWVFFREMCIALLLMVVFFYFGSVLMDALDVKQATVQISGGLILFLIAIRMIFSSEERVFGAPQKGEPFIVPIATPLLAGPSILATVMLYSETQAADTTVILAIGISWVLTVCVLWLSQIFYSHISKKVLGALERLMGLLLTLLAVETFLKGVKTFITTFWAGGA